MSREIKFRVWCNNKKEWEKDAWHIAYDGGIIDSKKMFEMKKQTHFLLQYTGLKDKNGKEIYEGDVVIQYEIPNKPFDVKREVFFSDGMFCVGKIGETETPLYLETNTSYRGKNVNLIEVIGNKFENPELLKEAK